MIPMTDLKIIESKEFSDLSDEEVLMWQYWTVFQEANLWYNMMVNHSSEDFCMHRLLSYAKKGKTSALKALHLQSSLMLLWANNAKKVRDMKLEEDRAVLSEKVECQTKTIKFLESNENVSEKEVTAFIAKNNKSSGHCEGASFGGVKKADKLDDVKATLAARGLAFEEGDGDCTRINMGLKILDNLFYSGKITEKVYNKKCKELSKQRAKIAA